MNLGKSLAWVFGKVLGRAFPQDMIVSGECGVVKVLYIVAVCVVGRHKGTCMAGASGRILFDGALQVRQAL